jgi:hypothetical protein
MSKAKKVHEIKIKNKRERENKRETGPIMGNLDTKKMGEREKEGNEIDPKGVAVDKRVICLCYFLLAGSLVMVRVGQERGCIEN